MKNFRVFFIVIAGLMISNTLVPMQEAEKKPSKDFSLFNLMQKQEKRDRAGFNLNKGTKHFKGKGEFDGELSDTGNIVDWHKSKSKNLDSEGSSESSDSE